LAARSSPWRLKAIPSHGHRAAQRSKCNPQSTPEWRMGAPAKAPPAVAHTHLPIQLLPKMGAHLSTSTRGNCLHCSRPRSIAALENHLSQRLGYYPFERQKKTATSEPIPNAIRIPAHHNSKSPTDPASLSRAISPKTTRTDPRMKDPTVTPIQLSRLKPRGLPFQAVYGTKMTTARLMASRTIHEVISVSILKVPL
jgi:hypothetical protein